MRNSEDFLNVSFRDCIIFSQIKILLFLYSVYSTQNKNVKLNKHGNDFDVTIINSVKIKNNIEVEEICIIK